MSVECSKEKEWESEDPDGGDPTGPASSITFTERDAVAIQMLCASVASAVAEHSLLGDEAKRKIGEDIVNFILMSPLFLLETLTAGAHSIVGGDIMEFNYEGDSGQITVGDINEHFDEADEDSEDEDSGPDSDKITRGPFQFK